MTGLDLAARRARLGWTVERLAELVNQHPDEVRRWETVTAELAGAVSRELDWSLANEERMQAMERSGIPECAWANAKVSGIDWRKQEMAERVMAELDEHVRACAVCQRRSAFAKTLPPLPPMPLPPTARVVIGVTTAIGRLPSWLRPAATGAVVVGAMTLVRAFFVLLFQRGAHALQTLVMVLAAVGVGAYAGAVGGFAYSLAKKPAARLGTFRPYALGLACGWAYLLSFGIPLRLFTHEEFFRTTTGWVILAVAATTLGLVVGHSWFRTRRSD